MTRLFALALSLLVAVPLGTQSAAAFEGIFTRHPKIDRRVATTATVSGVVLDRHLLVAARLEYERPQHRPTGGAFWAGSPYGCMVLSPMVAAALVPERHLTTREVFVLQGGCLIPVVGGWLVNAMFDANPHWEAHERPVQVSAKPKKRTR